MNGLLVIDKPAGMTSRTAVNRVQKWYTRKTKIGHTGTLDPLATGVLVVCVGAATRLADYVQAMGKSYTSRFRLGAVSTTDDADGTITETPKATKPTREQLEAALASFVGMIDQIPPAFSALKLGGVRAYQLARQGKGPELGARPVRIDAIRLTAYEWPFADVEVDCGKGTYIRSIARDVGDVLGCGGLVQTLRRTRIGPFTAARAISLESDPTTVKLLPMLEALCELPSVRLSRVDAARLRQGQRVDYEVTGSPAEVVLLSETGELVGIGSAHAGHIWPRTVFSA